MSILTDFAAAQFQQARTVIGGEDLTIDGGTAVSAILAEADNSREFNGGGFDRDQSLSAVVSITDWQATYPSADKAYLGKDATARGRVWRVGAIRSGQAFVTVSLESPRKAK